MEPTDTTERADVSPEPAPGIDSDDEPVEDLIEDELLVEEISVDGMCGVY